RPYENKLSEFRASLITTATYFGALSGFYLSDRYIISVDNNFIFWWLSLVPTVPMCAFTAFATSYAVVKRPVVSVSAIVALYVAYQLTSSIKKDQNNGANSENLPPRDNSKIKLLLSYTFPKCRASLSINDPTQGKTRQYFGESCDSVRIKLNELIISE